MLVHRLGVLAGCPSGGALGGRVGLGDVETLLDQGAHALGEARDVGLGAHSTTVGARAPSGHPDAVEAESREGAGGADAP